MGRSGYTDDCDNLELWRSAVDRSLRGKRGQTFLRDLLQALDAMPEKRLIASELVENGSVCTLGCAANARGLAISAVDPEDHERLSGMFNIAPAMVREIEYMNDEGSYKQETPEERWVRMRAWVVKNLSDALPTTA